MAKDLFSIFCFLAIILSVPAQEADNVTLKYALKFINTPYVAHTLEINDQEQLVINLKEVDCTTFVEYVLAMALSSSSDCCQPNNVTFARNLQNIRYRDGKINGYPSRLHYVADWVNNGVKYGFLEDIAATNSLDTVTLSLSFMSSHPVAYKQLVHSPENVAKMKKIEQSLSGQIFHYLPKNKLLDNGFSWIKNGDVIAITTDIPGLDVAHLGFAYYEKGILKLLHASSSKKKVVISNDPLTQILKNNKKFTGIRILRLKNK